MKDYWNLFLLVFFGFIVPVIIAIGFYYAYIWFTVTVVKRVWGG